MVTILDYRPLFSKYTDVHSAPGIFGLWHFVSRSHTASMSAHQRASRRLQAAIWELDIRDTTKYWSGILCKEPVKYV